MATLSSSSGQGHQVLNLKIAGSNPAESTMKTYEIKYRVSGSGCCGRGGGKAPQTIRVQADDPVSARKQLQKLSPGARILTIIEV